MIESHHNITFIPQFLNRRISSCQLAPKCTTESNIDDIYIHEEAVNGRLSQQKADFTYYKPTSRTNRNDNDYGDDVKLKTLRITSDDYIERQMPPFAFDVPYTNISDIDLTKFSSNVSMDFLVFSMCFFQSFLDTCYMQMFS